MTEDLPVDLLGILSLSVFSMVPNRVIGEMVLDGGGHFIPAGIFGLGLLSSRAAHERATGNTRDNTIEHTTRVRAGTVINIRQGGINSVPL